MRNLDKTLFTIANILIVTTAAPATTKCDSSIPGVICDFIPSSSSMEAVMAHVQSKQHHGRRLANYAEPVNLTSTDTNGNMTSLERVWTSPVVQSWSNCYNFATQLLTGTFAQPGRAHWNVDGSNSLTCAEAVQHSIADGLQMISKAEVGTDETYRYVALVVAPYQDYHWFRRLNPKIDFKHDLEDPNTRHLVPNETVWWHKPGSEKLMKVDWSGNTIYDIETADRGNYTDVCGYFKLSAVIN
jgi:hypothetical protein